MNTGMPIGELAKEITRQRDAKRDFLAPTRKVAVGVVERGGRPTPVLAMDLINQGVSTFNIGDVAHGQIAEKAGIPAKYYTRLKDEAPRLLAQNVNHWFQQAPEDEKRLIRVLATGLVLSCPIGTGRWTTLTWLKRPSRSSATNTPTSWRPR